jgi:alpha-1,2-mannosyltransferase
MKNWIERHWGCIALFVFAVAYYPKFGKGINSIALYVDAAHCVLDGKPLLECVPLFPYQPALAALFIPFVLIPVVLHKLVWYAICLGSLVIALRLSERMAEQLYPGATRGRNLIWLRLGVILLCLKFILDLLINQAYEAPALAIMVWGIWALMAGREAAGGFGLAVAAGVRATPLIFLPYLVLKRRWRAALVFVQVFAIVSVLPDIVDFLRGGHIAYFKDWVLQVATPGVKPGPSVSPELWDIWHGDNVNNQSLRGLIDRFVHDPLFGLKPSGILLLVYGGFAAVLAVLLLISPRDKGYAAIDGAVLLIAMLALSPMTSRYHYIFLLPADALVVAAVIMDRRMRVLGSVVLALSFLLLAGLANNLTPHWLQDAAYYYGFMIYGAMLMYVALAAMLCVWRPPGLAANLAAVPEQRPA